jgi:parallel beta-helix repeat protein
MQAMPISKFNGETIRSIFIVILTIISFIPVQSAAISVNPGDRIQAAIEEASHGGIIEVHSGIYYENLVLNKSLVLRGIDTGKGKPKLDARGMRTAVVINSSGINLEGFLVTNSSGPGIEIRSENNVIRSNEINKNDEGIALLGAINNTIQSNTVENNTKSGISITQSSENTIMGNKVIGNSLGISLRFSNNNSFIGNNVEGNDIDGIHLSHSKDNILIANIVSNNHKIGINMLKSENNILRENEMLGNRYNFNSEGLNDVDRGNLVEEMPIYYLIGANNIEINSTDNASTVYCINCKDVIIRDLFLAKNGAGLYLYNSSRCKIFDIQLSGNIHGVQLDCSKDNHLEITNATDNDYLLYIERSLNNSFHIDMINSSHNLYPPYFDSISKNNKIKDISAGPGSWTDVFGTPVLLTSEPSEAWITINGDNLSEKTPTIYRIRKEGRYNITMGTGGYRNNTTLLQVSPPVTKLPPVKIFLDPIMNPLKPEVY